MSGRCRACNCILTQDDDDEMCSTCLEAIHANDIPAVDDAADLTDFLRRQDRRYRESPEDN